MSANPDHPKQQLLFFVADDIDDDTARNMEALVAALQKTRTWSIGPPRFVDEVDDSSVSMPEDVPIRTVGGILTLYSTWPPLGTQLPRELDQGNFDDVEALIEVLTAFSSQTGREIDLELDGEPIGSIQQGVPDRMLREGFLAEWQRSLQERL